MKMITLGRKNIMNRISLFLLLMTFTLTLLLPGILVYADTGHEGEHGKPLEVVLQEIRAKQGLKPDEAIDPRKVSDEELEELGEAVMSIMHPDPRQHELMDQMIGGEGSESLKSAHIRMGYNYLAGKSYGNYGMFGRRGRRGMMGNGMMGRGMMGVLK